MGERKTTVVRAEVTGRIKEVFRTVFNFGRYPAPVMALLEFTDNSVAYRNQDTTNADPTTISINLDRDNGILRVTDISNQIRGRVSGGDEKSIEQFLQLADTTNAGVSRMGVGGKIAAWWFGQNLDITTKRAGENMQHHTKLLRFGDPTVKYDQDVTIVSEPLGDIPRDDRFDERLGAFEVKVTSLRSEALEELRKDAAGPTAIANALAETYRPLLIAQDVPLVGPKPTLSREVVLADGTKALASDGIILQLATAKKAREQIKPLEIPLADGSQTLSVGKTRRNEAFGYWVGELDMTNPQAKNVKPGIRVYYHGRLMDIDWFGTDKQDASLASLVGEIHVDNIIDIKDAFQINKSGGLTTNNPAYLRVKEAIQPLLEPWVRKLQEKQQASKEDPKVLKEVLQEAQSLVNQVLVDMNLSDLFKADIIVPTKRRQSGPPTPTPIHEPTPRPPHERKQTPVDDGPEKPIRLSAINGIVFVTLPDERDISTIGENPNVNKPGPWLLLNRNNVYVKNKVLLPLARKGIQQGDEIFLDSLGNLTSKEQRAGILELVVTELLEKLAIRRFSDTDRPLESFNEFMRDAKTRVGEKLYPNNPQSRRR